jgi:exodeoxyribonuclease III
MSDSLRLATFNANSIRIRLPQILEWLTHNHVDVLCVQETKVQDHEFPREEIEEQGYHVVYRGIKSHAGVAVISRHEPTEVAFGLDDGGEPDEERVIRLRIGELAVVNTYVPQGRTIDHEMFAYKLAWFQRLRALFARDYSTDELLVWTGDMNVAPEPIDVHDPVANKNHVDFYPPAREAFAEACAWGFVDVFRLHHPDEPEQYSYWDYRVRNALERGVGWRIDHILATPPLAERCTDAWIDREARQAERPSDHTMVVADFRL